MTTVTGLARTAIREMKAYQSARSLGFTGNIYLDANENPWDPTTGEPSTDGLNRYPSPQPETLLSALSELYGVKKDWLTVGRGVDDAIDWLVRTFCEAERDSILICPPTYGMYEVAAHLQGAKIVRVPTQKANGFALDVEAILNTWTPSVKLVFVCSPNNPTGNPIPVETLCRLAEGFTGKAILAVDEAYQEFAEGAGFLPALARFPNAVVMRTLSKAWALAGARCGTAIAHPELTGLLQKVRAPYPLSHPSLQVVAASLRDRNGAARRIQAIRGEREALALALGRHSLIRKVYPSEGNFLLVETTDRQLLLKRALAAGIVLRDRSSEPGLERCVRISVGTPAENRALLAALGGNS